MTARRVAPQLPSSPNKLKQTFKGLSASKQRSIFTPWLAASSLVELASKQLFLCTDPQSIHRTA